MTLHEEIAETYLQWWRENYSEEARHRLTNEIIALIDQHRKQQVVEAIEQVPERMRPDGHMLMEKSKAIAAVEKVFK